MRSFFRYFIPLFLLILFGLSLYFAGSSLNVLSTLDHAQTSVRVTGGSAWLTFIGAAAAALILLILSLFFIQRNFPSRYQTGDTGSLTEDESDGLALEELTVKDPDLNEVLDSFGKLRKDLEGNLGVVEAFSKRIDEEYSRRDVDFEVQLEDARAMEAEAVENRSIAGKFEVFKQIVKAFNTVKKSSEILGYIIEMAARLTKSARASIMLVDKSGQHLFLYKTLGWQSDAGSKELKVPMGEGFAGHVAKENKRMLVTDVEAEMGRGNKAVYQSKSFIILPIAAGERVAGVLNLTDKNDSSIYDFDDLELLNLLLGQASLALENAMLRHS